MARKIVQPSIPPSIKNDQGQYIKNPALVVETFALKNFLFDKQLHFVNDPRPFKIAVCSRRSGKTVACAADLIDTALATKEVVCLYITLSRNNAKKLIWPELKKINRRYKLGATEDATELSMSFPNGSVIYCSGAKDQGEIEKFRGLALKKVYIDECQSFREYIRELIDDILSPALLDYAGTLCLIGTPGPIPAGFFAECAGVVPDKVKESESWAKHGWTFFDNPYIEEKSGLTHDKLLERETRRRGVTLDDPSIQREFFGRWVLDSDSLWIHYQKHLNDYVALDPKHLYTYIMGIDLGFNDADAIAILAWSETDQNTYLVDELVVPKQGITELVDQVKSMAEKYKVSKMVIDEGGLGKKIAEEMRRRHHIPVQAADKARKQENVAFLNDTLRTGKFKAKYSSNFVKDSFLVEIDRSKSTPEKIKLSDKYHSDIIDAVLYAFRESNAFTYQEEAKKLPWGSKEWAERQSEEMFEQAQEHFAEQAEIMNNIKNNGYSS